MAQEIDILKQEFEIIKDNINFNGRRVLDLGCGPGRLSFLLATLADYVLGIDPEKVAIEEANKKISHHENIEFQNGFADNLILDSETFDVVIFSQSLCCIESKKKVYKALNEAWRVLKPNGKVVNIQASLQNAFSAGIIPYIITGDDAVCSRWDNVVTSRAAIKDQTFIDRKWKLLHDIDFRTKWSHDSIEEMMTYFEDRYEEFTELSEGKLKQIYDHVNKEYLRDEKVIYDVNETITILQKNE